MFRWSRLFNSARRRPAGRRIAAVLISAGPMLLACQSQPRPLPASEKKLDVPRPVSWLYHPRKKAEATARLSLGEQGAVLEVDEAGSRWLLREGSPPQASAFGAPEALVDVAGAPGAFHALGASGAVYFFAEALGAFTSVRTPPKSFVRARAVSGALVALTEGGELYRSEDQGQSWSQQSSAPRIFDLVASDERELLAYSVPERWYRSVDGGQNFSRLDWEPLAPRALERSVDGEAIIDGLYQRLAWREGRLTSVRKTAGKEQNYKLPHFAGAQAVAKGQAILEGESFFSLSKKKKKGAWEFAHGSLSEPLKTFELDLPTSCHSPVLGASGAHQFIACHAGARSELKRVELFRVHLHEQRLEALKVTLRGVGDQLKLRVSRSGSIALLGVCPRKRSDAGCQPSGVTVIEGDGRVHSLFAPGLPSPSEIEFDDESRLWAAGVRKKDQHLLLVGPLSSEVSSSHILDLSGQLKHQANTPVNLHAGSGGQLSVSYGTGLAWVGRDAQLLSWGTSPSGASQIAAVGEKVLALQAKEGVVWESQDGALSWQKSQLPREICDTGSTCRPALACSAYGCLIGEELTRLGWGAQAGAARSRVQSLEEGVRESERLPGYSCRPTETDWRELPGVVRMPGVASAALGDALWAEVRSVPSLAAADAIRAEFGEEQIRSEVLLAPVSDPEAYAFAVVPQVEGAAAMRFRLVASHQASQTTTLEVGWDNRLEGTIGRGSRLGDWGRRPMHHGRGTSRSHVAEPLYVGVAGRGLYVAMGTSADSSQLLYFESNGKNAIAHDVADFDWPDESTAEAGWFFQSAVRQTAREEMVRVFDRENALLLLAGSRVVVRRWLDPSRENAVRISPYLMGRLSDESTRFAQGIHVAYRGKQLGFQTLYVDTSREHYEADFVALGKDVAFEEPVPVPLLPDLSPTARPCRAQERELTPRVIAPSFPGPVRVARILELSPKPLELETGRAILFGTKKEPCVAVFEAEAARPVRGAPRYQALIAPGSVSWLFRVESQDSGQSIMAARPMKCESEALGGSVSPAGTPVE